MKSVLHAATLGLLATVDCLGQAGASGSFGPPVCPGVREAVHPSYAAIAETQSRYSQADNVLPSNEPLPNFTVERYRLRDYGDCVAGAGCYWADLDAQIARAQTLMEADAKAQPRGTKLAIVLDIDETSLTNYCEELREDFTYVANRYDAWTISPAAAMPIQGTVELVHKAESMGIAIFFITGRPEEQRAATESNLRAAGYSNWTHLALKQPDPTYTSTAGYKSAEREKIVKAGYKLVLNMGDQWSDLQLEPEALHNVKLPNPFYYLP